MAETDEIRRVLDEIDDGGPKFSTLIRVRPTPEYKRSVFTTWYRAGKPQASALLKLIDPDPTNGFKYNQVALSTVITSEFRPMAESLDAAVQEELESRLIREKIEMLDRHSKTGVKMQDIALEFIDSNKDQITMNSALKLLIEGIRVERESRGIPQALEKMMLKSDDDLLADVQKILSSAEIVDVSPNED